MYQPGSLLHRQRRFECRYGLPDSVIAHSHGYVIANAGYTEAIGYWHLLSRWLVCLFLPYLSDPSLTRCSGCVAGAVRVYFLTYMYRSNDITWNQTDCFIWSCVEPATGIVSACLPTLRPLLRRFFPSLFTTLGSSRNTGSSSNDRNRNGEFYRLHQTPKNAIYRGQDEDEIVLTEAVGGNNSTPKHDGLEIAVEREIEWSESSREPPRRR